MHIKMLLLAATLGANGLATAAEASPSWEFANSEETVDKIVEDIELQSKTQTDVETETGELGW